MTGSLGKNLNIVVKFFNERTKRVEQHFLDVIFLAQETTLIQLEVIRNAMGEFDITWKQVSQLGRDDPAVNKLLVKMFKAEQAKVTGKSFIYDTEAYTEIYR